MRMVKQNNQCDIVMRNVLSTKRCVIYFLASLADLTITLLRIRFCTQDEYLCEKRSCCPTKYIINPITVLEKIKKENTGLHFLWKFVQENCFNIRLIYSLSSSCGSCLKPAAKSGTLYNREVWKKLTEHTFVTRYIASILPLVGVGCKVSSVSHLMVRHTTRVFYKNANKTKKEEEKNINCGDIVNLASCLMQ